jgi:small conductance mechanosensitive channel
MFLQVRPPSTTSVPNPAEGLVEGLTNLDDACGEDPSWACEWVFDRTGNQTLAGVVEWFVARPLTIAAIVVGALLVARLARALVERGMRRRAAEDRRRLAWLASRTPSALQATESWNLRAEARRQTLTAVFQSVVSIAVWTVAVIWILNVLELDFGPLVAGAGILGVALGFGAQNVVRDVLAGYFLVVEDQFGVGDIVDLGPDAKGTVERITLRATRVRDVNGTVWHVPNGQILRAGNKSQVWARALLDIEVELDTPYDRVQAVIAGVAEELATEHAWEKEVVATPEIWGIENFTTAGYVVRLVVKTRPGAQWGVMRELRIRLKKAFDDAGIGFAGAHQEVWIRAGEPRNAPEPIGSTGTTDRRSPSGTPESSTSSSVPDLDPADGPDHPRRGDLGEA